jgi:xylulokinase
VGNDNLFLSNEFSKTISNTLGITIEMLEATGAEGAAKASISGLNGGAVEEKIKITKTISPDVENHEISIQAFKNWKNQLINNII